MIEEARRLDERDALSEYRERFHLPDGVIYLDGNSLGALPKATPDRLQRLISEDWSRNLIRSWNATADGPGWIDMPQRVGAKIAPLIGAKPHEVIVADSVSVNLFKLIAAALALQKDKRRKVVLSEPGNFPTDLYMIQGLEKQGLATQRLADRDTIESALDEDVALLLLTHVHYKTGAKFDMVDLTRKAQESGALVLWDLSHSGGALPVHLNEANADFATGCGYKYLNGGPGAPAYLFVAERHLRGVEPGQGGVEQPLTGWMGHHRPFDFVDRYEPGEGIDRMLCGTPPILSMAALEEGVDLVAEIGIERLWDKSKRLSQFFLQCLRENGVDLELVSPADPEHRGSQLSFRHENAFALCQAMIARGVIGDFRAPDVLRFGFAPAYLRFEDMAQTARHLAEVIESEEWRRSEFNERSAVT